MITKKICLIGNSGGKRETFDGQTLKVRLYKDIFDSENIPFVFVDLYKFSRNLPRILFRIWRSIKESSVVLLMAGANGCRKLLPLINFINRDRKRTIVVSMIGRGVLAISLDKKHIDSNKFFLDNDFGSFSDDRMKKNLEKVDHIVLETDLLTNGYARFFRLTNCQTLYNFRKSEPNVDRYYHRGKKLRLIFLSRIRRDKGIFDIIEAVQSLSNSYEVALDIFGELELSDADKLVFINSAVGPICYKGKISNSEVVRTIAEYDYFVFPTHCSEGMPGVLIESLLAGTPIISSRFTQSKDILAEGEDSLLFNSGDVEELKRILVKLVKDRSIRDAMARCATINSLVYSFSYNKNKLFSLLGIIE